mmetsp:Transcript_86840/g.250862  ORF Transcript_86840/g.250862 Transcript_86840/m.250862 type:complete len:233 (-) Transcript_86840:478-1176(-)
MFCRRQFASLWECAEQPRGSHPRRGVRVEQLGHDAARPPVIRAGLGNRSFEQIRQKRRTPQRCLRAPRVIGGVKLPQRGLGAGQRPFESAQPASDLGKKNAEAPHVGGLAVIATSTRKQHLRRREGHRATDTPADLARHLQRGELEAEQLRVHVAARIFANRHILRLDVAVADVGGGMQVASRGADLFHQRLQADTQDRQPREPLGWEVPEAEPGEEAARPADLHGQVDVRL